MIYSKYWKEKNKNKNYEPRILDLAKLSSKNEEKKNIFLDTHTHTHTRTVLKPY